MPALERCNGPFGLSGRAMFWKDLVVVISLKSLLK